MRRSDRDRQDWRPPPKLVIAGAGVLLLVLVVVAQVIRSARRPGPPFIDSPDDILPWLGPDSAPGPTGAATNRRLRIVCPVCDSWIEHDHLGFMAMFIDGFEPDSPDAKASLENRRRVMPFMAQHLECCKQRGESLRFVEEASPAFHVLRAEKQFIPPDGLPSPAGSDDGAKVAEPDVDKR